MAVVEAVAVVAPPKEGRYLSAREEAVGGGGVADDIPNIGPSTFDVLFGACVEGVTTG